MDAPKGVANKEGGPRPSEELEPTTPDPLLTPVVCTLDPVLPVLPEEPEPELDDCGEG